MKNSPIPSHELITEMLQLIKQGSSSHRCRIKNAVLIFDNPHVQSLHTAVNEFKKQPSPETFDSIKSALAKCKENDISTYNYKEIEEICEILTPPPTPTITKKKPY